MWQTRKRKQVRGNIEPWINGKSQHSSSSSLASDNVSFQFLVLNTKKLHLESEYRQWDNLIAKLFGPTKITAKLQNDLLEKVNIPETSNQKKITGSAEFASYRVCNKSHRALCVIVMPYRTRSSEGPTRGVWWPGLHKLHFLNNYNVFPSRLGTLSMY